MKKRINIITLLALTAIVGVVLFQQLPQSTQERPTFIVQTRQGVVVVPVELAITPEEKTQGLADRDALAAGNGMLFVWEDDLLPIFTMAGMRFSLDILFINSSGEITHIAEQLPLCADRVGCTTVAPPQPIRHVLEVNAGFVQRHAIMIGDRVLPE